MLTGPGYARRARAGRSRRPAPLGGRRGLPVRADRHRDAAHLTLTVDGTPAALSPGRGRFTRDSFRVDVRLDGVHHRFQPSDEDGSRLLRDGQRLGELMLEPETVELMAVWSPGAEVRPQDAAIGYALATAFGTEAESTLSMLVNTLTGGHH